MQTKSEYANWVKPDYHYQPRVIKPNGKIIRVQNLGWLIRHARQHSIQEFRVYRAVYNGNYQLHVIVKFFDGHIYATRYASLIVMRNWLNRSYTLPRYDTITFKGWD